MAYQAAQRAVLLNLLGCKRSASPLSADVNVMAGLADLTCSAYCLA